jgi:hypothetical protein
MVSAYPATRLSGLGFSLKKRSLTGFPLSQRSSRSFVQRRLILSRSPLVFMR